MKALFEFVSSKTQDNFVGQNLNKNPPWYTFVRSKKSSNTSHMTQLALLIYLIMSVSFISPASTACADLDMPFRQYDSASAYDVYYYSFDVDSRVITGTGARTPTYDIFIGGQVDNGSIIKPLITSLQASNNYAPLWSYTVNMGNQNIARDVKYSENGVAVLFVLDDTVNADNKKVYLGRAFDMTTQTSTPTVEVYLFTSGSQNIPIYVGDNFAAMENQNVVYMAVRTIEFTNKGSLSYAKINFSTQTVTHHLETTTQFGGETISLITGEYPVSNVFIAGWRESTSGGSTYRMIWVVKASSSNMEPTNSFSYEWTQTGWETTMGFNADSAFYPDIMDYQTGYVYIGATMHLSQGAVTTKPVLIFYLESTSLTLQNSQFVYIQITGQQLEIEGYNIMSTGIMNVFVQAPGQEGYYLVVDLTQTDQTQAVNSFMKVNFFNAAEAQIAEAIFFFNNLGENQFWYIGYGNQNICTANETPFTKLYGFINIVSDGECPCLEDQSVIDTIAYDLTITPLAISTANADGVATQGTIIAFSRNTISSTLAIVASASVSALSASFLSELSVCSSANVGTPNCACSHVLTTEPVSPIQTIGSEDTNVYTYGVTKFTLAYSGCDTFPVTNPSLTCYTDNTYTILKTCILVEVAETATVYEVTIGDGVSTFTNTNVGNQYVRLTASSDYGMSGYVDFYFTITYTITACEQGYTGTDSCTDPCGYNYDGIETCSPCSDTYDDGPYAGLETCGPCDDGYAATNPDPVLDCTPCTDRYDQSDMQYGDIQCDGCWYDSPSGSTCEPCDQGYQYTDGTELCDPCNILYNGDLICTPCYPEYGGTDVCSPCDDGYVEYGGTDECTPCSLRYEGDLTCNACYADYTGTEQCAPCDDGYAEAGGTEECTPCTLRYSGPLQCTPCYADYQGDETECTPCHDGYEGISTVCTPCTVGYTGTQTCTPCYEDYDGAETVCSPCDSGYQGTDECTPCTLRYSGSFECNQCYEDSPDYGIIECGPCDQGYSGESTCSPCQDGYTGSLTCGACDEGYQGTAICTPCTDRSPKARLCDDPCSKNYRGVDVCYDPYNPLFVDYDPEDPIEISVMKGVQNTFYIPEVDCLICDRADRNGNTWSLTCWGDHVGELLHVNRKDQEIDFNVGITSKLKASEYNILCSLKDDKNSAFSGVLYQTTYMLKITLQEFDESLLEDGIDPNKITGDWGGWQPPQPKPETQEPEPEIYEEDEYIPEYGSLEKIDRVGEVTIQFLNQMRWFDYKQINGDTFKISINTLEGTYYVPKINENEEDIWKPTQQSPGRRLENFSVDHKKYIDSSYNELEGEWNEKLNFTWYPKSFIDNNKIILQLNFEYPLNVSLRDFHDSILINFTDPSIFIEWGKNETVIPYGYTMIKEMPSQLDRETRSSFLAFVNILMLITGIICAIYIVFMSIFGQNKDFLWTFIHYLQIYTHFLMFDLKFSANCHVLLQTLLDFARLRIVPATDWTERMFKIQPNRGLFIWYEYAGYDQTNLVHTLAFVNTSAMIIAFTLLVIWTSQYLIDLAQKQKNKRIHNFVSKTIWGASHRFLLLAIIELMLCPPIFIMGRKVLAYSIILTILAVGLIIYLLVRMFQVLYLQKDNIGEKNFDIKFSTFYASFRQKAIEWQTKWSLAYYPLFFLRRLLFVVIILSLYEFPGQQLQLSMLLSCIWIIYIGYVQPIVNIWVLAFEILDEFITISICYLMLQFSDYYPDDNVLARYKVGTAVNALVVFHIVYRVLLMLGEMLYTAYRLIMALLKGEKVHIQTKKVPERHEDDFHYPYDVTEFTDISDGPSSKRKKMFWGRSANPKLKAAEYWLHPEGHPRYVDKYHKNTVKLDTIDEYSFEATIHSQSEEEILEEDVEIVEEIFNPNEVDGEHLPLKLSQFKEPISCTINDQAQLMIQKQPLIPSGQPQEEDLGFLSNYRPDSGYAIRNVKEADKVTFKNTKHINPNDLKTADVDFWAQVGEYVGYQSDDSPDEMTDYKTEFTNVNIELQTQKIPKKARKEKTRKPQQEETNEDFNSTKTKLLTEEFKAAALQKIKQKQNSYRNQYQKRQAQPSDEEDEEKPTPFKYGGGHKFFRAIATSLQRKSEFAAIKAQRSNVNTFDRVTTTIFQPQESIKQSPVGEPIRQSLVNEDLNQSVDGKSPNKRYNITKVNRFKVADQIIQDDMIKDIFLQGMMESSTTKQKQKQSNKVQPQNFETVFNSGIQDQLFDIDDSQRQLRPQEEEEKYAHDRQDQVAIRYDQRGSSMKRKKQRKKNSEGFGMYQDEIKRLVKLTFGSTWKRNEKK